MYGRLPGRPSEFFFFQTRSCRLLSHKEFGLLESRSILFPRMLNYIPVYMSISVHMITYLNKDKLFRVLGVSPFLCATDFKLPINRHIYTDIQRKNDKKA